VQPQLAAVVSKLFPFPSSVRIPNVQAEIDESEALRQQQRNPDDFWSDFHTNQEISDWLTEQANAHPTKASRISIGQSYEGNDIYAFQIGKDATIKKPAILIHCGIHAREWISPSTCCWIIDQLLNQETNAKVLSYEWVIIPVMNVDGYEYTHLTNRLWRKNRQPNTGSTCIGTDLNRNYGFRWGGPGSSSNPCSETFAGRGAFSGPETAAVRALMNGYIVDGRLDAFFDIHAYGAYWMSPWGYTCALPPDYDVMDALMQVSVAALRQINGRSYTYGAACETIYQTSGDSTDDTYGNGKITHSYCVEAYGSNFTPPPSSIIPIGTEIWAGVRQSAISM